jgi:hypothetical protein
MTSDSLAVLQEAQKDTVKWELQYPNGRVTRTGAIGPATSIPDRIPLNTVKGMVFHAKNHADEYDKDEIRVEHPDGTTRIVPVVTATESVRCDGCGEVLLGATKNESLTFCFEHECSESGQGFTVNVVSDPLSAEPC